MDDSSKHRKNAECNCKKKTKNCNPDGCHVLQPFWVRCAICNHHGVDRVLLDYGLNLLLPFGAFLWIIFLVTQAL
jgi:hypothetical protein